MNKPIGLLVIGLGIIMIAIGITGTQSKILADLKAVNPKLRQTVPSNVGGQAGGAPKPSTGGNAPNPVTAM